MDTSIKLLIASLIIGTIIGTLWTFNMLQLAEGLFFSGLFITIVITKVFCKNGRNK